VPALDGDDMEQFSEQHSDLLIRRFNSEDYQSMISVWEQSDLPFKPNGRDSREKVLKEITQNTAIFLVAEKEGEVIGAVLGTHDGRKGWINRLAVIPKYRHQGIAIKLIEKVEQELYQCGIDIIACLIEDYNSPSTKLFEQVGYVKHTDIIYFSKRKHKNV
jgi:ribosomal protein S18 acetylase RimI-like enzyme